MTGVQTCALPIFVSVPGGVVDGNEVKMVVKPGDKVVVAKYAGTEVKVEDVEYSIVRQSEILAIVE